MPHSRKLRVIFLQALRCPGLGLTERRLCRAEQVDLYALRPRWHGCLRRPRSALPRARLCFRPARRARAVPLLGRSDSTAHQAEPGSSVFRGFDCPERGYPRLGRPCGPSHAIGCADPRRGVYSPGLAPAGGRARIRIVVLGESAKGPWGVMGDTVLAYCRFSMVEGLRPGCGCLAASRLPGSRCRMRRWRVGRPPGATGIRRARRGPGGSSSSAPGLRERGAGGRAEQV